MDRMRNGCVTDSAGANVPAPAEDLDNENPSLVALGKKGSVRKPDGRPFSTGSDRFSLVLGPETRPDGPGSFQDSVSRAERPKRPLPDPFRARNGHLAEAEKTKFLTFFLTFL